MSTDTRYDAIIVGGGHNGLVCGSYLARAGLNTVVVEKRPLVGGAAVTEEIHPGFRASRFSYIMGHLHPKVIADLELDAFGLEFMPVPDVIYPLEDDCITFTKDPVKNIEQIRRFSRRDAEAFPAFFEHMSDSIKVLRSLLLETPIDPAARDVRHLRQSASLLWRYRKIGKNFYRMIDAVTKSADQFVSEWFESEIVRAVLCYWATIGCNVGPKSPGTAFNILFHLVGESGMGFSRGGMGSISSAIAASGASHGLEIRTGCPVARIVVEQGEVKGVALDTGEQIHAPRVISNVGAPITFGTLVPRSDLPDEFMADIDRYRSHGSAFKINLAVDRAPVYKSFDPGVAGVKYPAYAHIGPSVDYLERAYDDMKYGWYSSKPFISPIVPSAIDDSLAPPGKHVVTLYGGHCPYELKGASWENEKDNFVRNVLDVMDDYAPGFSDSIIAMDAMVPPDIEREIGAPGGHELHGEAALDQLFFKRPVPHYADYRSPIQGLYQCGASTHPGGAVSGVPGHNAAREILIDAGRRR